MNMKKIIAFFMMLVFTVTVTTGCFAAEPVTENNHTQVFFAYHAGGQSDNDSKRN